MREDPVGLGWETKVAALLRPSLLLAFWASLAAAVAMTLLVEVPPGLDQWAHLLATAVRSHHHHRAAGTILDEAQLRWMFEAAFYACWAATAVLAVGLFLSWRLLFGGLHRWGTHGRF
jgi:hypothetical protein